MVQHFKLLWRHVSNIHCCSQFDGGEIGFQPIRPVEQNSDIVKSFCCVSVLHMHFWVQVRSYQSELVVSGCWFERKLSIFEWHYIPEWHSECKFLLVTQ